MWIVIAGAGRVGKDIARELRNEKKFDVVLIDSDATSVKNAQSLDALVIHGDTRDRKVLEKAGVLKADAFIAATDSDEMNLIACMMANQAHEQATGKGLKTIARLRNQNYIDEANDGNLSKWASVDHAVDPVKEAISQLQSGLRSDAIDAVIPFEHDAFILELSVTDKATHLFGKTLKQLGNEGTTPLPLIVGAKSIGGEKTVPGPEYVIQPEDKLAVTAMGVNSFKSIVKLLGHEPKSFPESPTVVIIGGTRLGMRIAKSWLRTGAQVTIIEEDLQKANQLIGSTIGSDPNFEVIQGNHFDDELLDEIGYSSFDVCISALDGDHTNIAALVMAKEKGIEKTGMILKDDDLVNIVKKMGISFSVDIKHVAVNTILSRLHTANSGTFAILAKVNNVVGFKAKIPSGSRYIGKNLHNINLGRNVRVGFIQRSDNYGNKKTFDHTGTKEFIEGDQLVIFCEQDKVVDLMKKFEV